MARRGVVVLGVVLLSLWVSVPDAMAQKVKDFVEVEGARSNYLIGEGLVIGLNGNGDSGKGLTPQRLRMFLSQHAGWNVKDTELSSKNVAMVIITAELPPFQAEGARIDVQISAIGDAKSLAGGTLLSTPLRSPRGRAEDPTIYALAQGSVVVDGDARSGNQTSARIPKGAMVENPLSHEFVKTDSKGNRYIVLNLHRTDFSMANTIANHISQSDRIISQDYRDQLAREGKQVNLAYAVDGGTVAVRIPTQEESGENFVANPVKFVSRVMTDVDIQLVDPEKALVIINDKTKIISTTGTVKVKPGAVRVKSIVVKIPPEMTVSVLLEQYRDQLSAQDMIDVIKELDQSGHIKGMVISR